MSSFVAEKHDNLVSPRQRKISDVRQAGLKLQEKSGIFSCKEGGHNMPQTIDKSTHNRIYGHGRGVGPSLRATSRTLEGAPRLIPPCTDYSRRGRSAESSGESTTTLGLANC